MNRNIDQEPQLPSPAEVDSAFIEVYEYNEQHTGLGKAMGGLMLGLIKIAEEEETGVVSNEPQIDSAGEADIAKDIISMTTGYTFDRVGLTLMNDGYAAVGGDRAGGEKQQATIKNPGLYVSFLETVDGDMDDLPALKVGVIGVLDRLVSGVTSLAASDTEDGGSTSTVVLEAGAGLVERLMPEYQRLANAGVDIDFEDALKLLNWSSKPEFADFFKAERLMGKQGTFSLENWYLDSSPENFTDKWNKVTEHYSSAIKQYGPESDLVLIMKSRMEDGIKASEAWLKSSDYPKSYVDNLRPSVEFLKIQIHEMGIVPREE